VVDGGGKDIWIWGLHIPHGTLRVEGGGGDFEEGFHDGSKKNQGGTTFTYTLSKTFVLKEGLTKSLEKNLWGSEKRRKLKKGWKGVYRENEEARGCVGERG